MFTIQGHRGARALFPENTLEGFRRTVALGVGWIELDVGVLKDGTVVVHHDLALNPDLASLGGRFPAGSLPLLKDLTSEDIEDFDVGTARPGSDVAARFPNQVAIPGARIPALADVLAIDASTQWTIELKLMPDRPDWTVPAEEMVERVLAVVDRADAAARVVIQSFDWRGPRHARTIRPEVRRAWLTAPAMEAEAALWWDRAAGDAVAAIVHEGGGTWAPWHGTLTEEGVQAARAAGVGVVPWTVNDAADMGRFRDWGVDGVITDDPTLWVASD